MDWFLYDNGLRHERVNIFQNYMQSYETELLIDKQVSAKISFQSNDK